MILGFRQTDSAVKYILGAADNAQKLIVELHRRDRDNETFEQVGFLNGREIVKDYIDHNEWGLAWEHLLYMIHESDISFPVDILVELHELARQNGIPIEYAE